MSHASIPVFVPHLACPNQCIFCDQKKIAGTEEAKVEIYDYLYSAASELSDRFSEVDIAFFGGSFTGIPEPTMRSYLENAVLIREKFPEITGIRLSTRPDYINEHILAVLKEYGVTAIELGGQSMCDDVLFAAKRGHTSAQTEEAAKMIKSAGFELVIQTMTGLYLDTPEKDIETAKKVIALKPDGVRIYPCITIKGTELERLFSEGKYMPQTLDAAVGLCATLAEMYEESGIKILRIGLHGSDLYKSDSVAAGPFHPAFGELTEGEIIYRRLRKELAGKVKPGDVYTLSVSSREVSKTVGQKRRNIVRLEDEFKIKIKINVI